MAKDRIKGLTIELNADTAGILDSLKELNSSLSKTQSSLKDVNSLLKLDPGNVTLLGQKQEYLTKAIEDTQAKLEKEKALLEEMQKASNSSETEEQQKRLAREIEDTSIKLNKYQTELEETTGKLNDMGKGAEEAGKGINETENAVMMIAKSEAFEKIAESAQKLYDTLMECDDAADKFETSMAKVETLAHAGEGLDAMASEIKNYAAALGVSASDFAEGVYQAMSASIAAEDAVEFTANMTKLAVGGFTATATAVDIVTTVINAYGLAAEDATHIMDNLIATQNLGKTTVDELASSMGKVIPTASAYSVNIDQLSAAYAELTAKGIKTRITTTDLNAMFQELGNTEKDVNNILQELTGDTFGQFMEKGNSLGDVMALLWDYAGKDKEAFYGLWSQSTAATAAFNIAADGGKRFNELLKEMQNNAGLAEENFQTIAETSEMLDARFESTVENLKIAIGDALGPTLDSVKQKGMDALEPLTRFAEENPKLVAALSDIVIGVVGVTTAVTAAATAVSILRVALGDIAGIGAIIGAGAIVGGIGGLAIAMNEAAESAEGLNKEVQASKAALDENFQQYDANGDKVNRLAREITNLNESENLNGAQTRKLAEDVRQWNMMMDENNQLILDSTGHLEGLTDELYNNIEAAAEAYEMELHKKELTELTEKYFEAEEALAEANNKVAEAQERVNEAASAQDHGNALRNLEFEKQARDELAQTVGDYAQKYDELTQKVREETAVQEENNRVSEEAVQAAKAAAEAQEELVEAYQKAYESAVQSLEGQRDIFQNFSTDVGTSVDEMAKNFTDQAEGMKQYAQLVADAYEIMQKDPSSEDLLNYYISQGPEAAGSLDNLVTAFYSGEEGLKAFSDAVTAFNETTDLIDVIGKLTEGIETGYTEPITYALEYLETEMPTITETMQTNFDEQQAAADENKTKMTEIASGTVTEMASAVSTNSSQLSTASQKLMDDAYKATKDAIGITDESDGRSAKFYELGKNIDQSIADGITENAGLVTSAVQGMMDSAMNSIDFSGFTSRINQALGAAFGG